MKFFRRANICVLVILSLLTVSCRLVDPITPDIPLYVRSFSVSGVVTDISGEPLRNIAVSVRAYGRDDKERSSEKYYCLVSTGEDGKYSFNRVWPDNAADNYFVFLVSDPSGVYASIEREMFISSTSPFYGVNTQSYDVTGNDFTLSFTDSPEEK